MRHFALYPLMFLFSIVLARGLGPNNYGIYAGLMAMMGVLALFSSLGLDGVSSITLPQIDPEEYQAKAAYFIKKVFIIRISSTLFTLCFFLLMPEYFFRLIMGKDLVENMRILMILFSLYFFISNINLLSMSFYRGLLKKFKL